jgi:hypothetical protein
MIGYFYKGDYDAGGLPRTEEYVSVLEFHAKMFSLADKYDVQPLGKRAVARYQESLKNSRTLDFLASLPIVYDATPPSLRSLRDIALRHAQTVIPQLARQEGTLRDAFLEGVKNVPDFAMDVCEDWLTSRIHGSCRDCGPWQPVQVLQARCLKCNRGGASV